MKPILILGGYGSTGRVVTSLLAKETKYPLIVAGRNLSKAEDLANQLNKKFKTKRISAIFCDASKKESLKDAFRGIKLVVVASNTAEYAPSVAKAALVAKADYLDYHFSEKIISSLTPYKDSIKKQKRIFITQAGFHPGLPATFVRLAAPYFDQYRKALVAMAMTAKFESVESSYELIDAIGDYHADIFVNGKWRSATYKDMHSFDFGFPFGKQSCVPIQMDEIKALPKMLGLNEVGVLVAGFNWFTNYITSPLIILAYKIKKGFMRKQLATLLVWGTNTFPSKNEGVVFVLEAEGLKNEKPMNVRLIAQSLDPYAFTAIPVVACILQYLDHTISQEGLHLMGHIVDPQRLLKDMERMGVKVKITLS